MPSSESKIRQAILHTEEEVRLTALRYFTDSYSDDESLMPPVIQAVEEYGRDNGFRILRDAENLRQTDATLDWLFDERRHDFDTKDVADDNYRFAVAIVIHDAPVALLEVVGPCEYECYRRWPEATLQSRQIAIAISGGHRCIGGSDRGDTKPIPWLHRLPRKMGSNNGPSRHPTQIAMI